MIKKAVPEVWLRGPLPDLSPFLQPVGHALLQAREEIRELMEGFPEERLWDRPAGLASAGFHVQHLTGVLDRLLTYARRGYLDREQLSYLGDEGKPNAAGQATGQDPTGSRELVDRFARQVDLSLEQLRNTPEITLNEARGVGRAQLPSTVLGLLVHAAEHVQRHTGQLLVTARILRSLPAGPLPTWLQPVGKN